MKILNKLETRLNNIADDLDRKRIVNSVEDKSSNESYLDSLNIPVVGGFVYIYNSYRQADKFMKEYNKKQNMRKHVINVIKEEEKVSRSIRRQLDSFLDSKDVAIIEVPNKHMSKFKKVMEDYSESITWSQRSDGKIVLVRQNAI